MYDKQKAGTIMTTNIQKTIIARLKSELRLHIEPVKNGAIGIETPFIDWKGCSVTIYVTADGRVTDGGNTLNELIAMRVIEKFRNWRFKEDYFQRYNIREGEKNELEPTDTENPLSYLQGIARLGHFFPPNLTTSSAKSESIYDKLTESEVASFIEKFKNEYSNTISEQDEEIIMQAVKRLRKNEGGE